MIDIEAWNKAVWRGAGFVLGYMPLPVLLLPFVNEKYAIRIFEDWIKIIGRDDKRGYKDCISRRRCTGEASGYYVVVGNNIDEAMKRAEKGGFSADETMILNVSRIIRANPRDNFKLFNYFKEAYHQYGEYMLMPAVLNEKTGEIKPLPQYGIHKSSWFIGIFQT